MCSIEARKAGVLRPIVSSRGPDMSWTRSRVRQAVAAVCAIVGGLAIATPVHAATSTTLVASPGGSGTTCSTASPCAITQAFTSAGNGDTIILSPGSYGSPNAELNTTLVAASASDVVIEGQPGHAAPVIYSSAAPGINLINGSLSNVSIINTAGLGVPLLGSGNNSIDHVTAVSDGDYPACNFSGNPDLRDSLCDEQAGSDATNASFVLTADGEDANATLTGDTIIINGQSNPVQCDALHGGACDLYVTNSILFDPVAGRAPYLDAYGAGSTASATVRYSDLPPPMVYGGQGASTPTVDLDSTDLDASKPAQAPKLDPASFRELAGSPTIDTGSTAADSDATDLTGTPRRLGAAVDMGAFEFTPKPQASDPTLSQRSARRIEVTIAVTSGGLPGTARLYATNAKNTVESKTRSFTASYKSHEVTLAVHHLHPDTRYDLAATVQTTGGEVTTDTTSIRTAQAH